jgi:proline iminopeptidase
VDGRYEVWVKQLGSGKIPVLTLHGGPGFPHYYFECFEDFLPQDRIRFYYYDQLGIWAHHNLTPLEESHSC